MGFTYNVGLMLREVDLQTKRTVMTLDNVGEMSFERKRRLPRDCPCVI